MTGQRISDYLKENGIKQKWLADRVGVTEAQMSNCLNSKTTISAELLFQICSALGVSSEEFRGETSA